MTDVNLSPGADTGTDTAPISGAVIGLLVTVALIAGAASLMMSFHGLRDLVQRVEDVHGWLSDVGPVGIDGLQLAALFAIIVTVTAPFKVRLYLWTVFFGSIGLSVAGNIVDASARHAETAGVVLSGVWPALLAAATHVVVMAVRWWQQSATEATAAPVSEVAADEIAEPAEVSGPKSPSRNQIRSWARTRYQTARSCSKVAADMQERGWDVSVKQIERWTQDLRTKAAATDIAPDPATA